MTTLNRIITTPDELASLQRLLDSRKLPMTVAIKDGKHRTNEQNRLQHKWYQEAAEQIGEYDTGEYKSRCKLRFGVPILRATNDGFNDMWERRAENLPHEEKVEMMEFINVTSLMNTKEKGQYLTAVQKFFLQRGVQLTDPEDKT